MYGGLYPLLLETIARDSEKHATILRYLLLEMEGRTGMTSGRIGYPAELEADVALRDGSIAHIRPIRADDEALLAFLRELSDDDRRLRFFSLGNDLTRTAHDEADVDYVHSLGLLATVGPPSGSSGTRCTRRPASGARREVAFAIAAEYQGRGLATMLLGQLAERRGHNGIDTSKRSS